MIIDFLIYKREKIKSFNSIVDHRGDVGVDAQAIFLKNFQFYSRSSKPCEFREKLREKVAFNSIVDHQEYNRCAPIVTCYRSDFQFYSRSSYQRFIKLERYIFLAFNSIVDHPVSTAFIYPLNQFVFFQFYSRSSIFSPSLLCIV